MMCYTMFVVREEPLTIWGGRAKSGKKNSTATRAEKKTQLNNPEEKKRVQRLVAEEKKLNANSLPGAPPDH